MKKTIISGILAAVLAVSCLAFTACGPNYSETYMGTLSENVYQSEEEAAKDFLAKELASSTASVHYLGYTKQADLTVAEIAVLDLGEDAESPVSAEMGEVEYAFWYSYSGTGNSETRKLYILNYNNSYKYYAPIAEAGETITASYFNTFFNPELYKNCSLKWTVESYESGVYQKIEYGFNVNELYGENTASYDIYGEHVEGKNYLIPYNSGYYQVDSEGSVINYVSNSSLSSVILNSLNGIPLQLYGHSAFVKTNDGFELRREFSILNEITITIKVNEGKIKEINYKEDFEFGNCTMTLNFEYDTPDVINIPDKVKEQLPELF